MKNLIFALVFLVSFVAEASQLTHIDKLANSQLESARAAIVERTFVSRTKMKKVKRLSGRAQSAQELRQNTLAQALHMACGFFDEGVTLHRVTKNKLGTEEAVSTFLSQIELDSKSEDFKVVRAAIAMMNAEKAVEVYVGSASGNNTIGSVLGVYDLIHNEIAVFAITNCGSDS